MEYKGNLPEVRRGDVFFLKTDDSVGSEIATGRPIVIVSSDAGNETSPTVIGAFTTSQPRTRSIDVEVSSLPKRSWVLCSQIVTSDKQRLGKKLGRLTVSEMARVDKALQTAMYLPEKTGVSSDELKDRDNQIEALKDELLEMSVNLAFYKKAYEKVLDRLVDSTVEAKMSNRPDPVVATVETTKEPPVAEQSAEPPVVKQEPIESTADDKPKRPELNTCSFDDLREIGITTNIALNIIAARPFKTVDDLRLVPGVTQVAFQIIQRKITVEPISVKREIEAKKLNPKPTKQDNPTPKNRVNINKATSADLIDKVGMGKTLATNIVIFRSKHGFFTSVDDLLKVRSFGKARMNQFKEFLEV